MTERQIEEYFIVLALDGNEPSAIETAEVVDVVDTRKEAEKLINETESEKRLEILPVRV